MLNKILFTHRDIYKTNQRASFEVKSIYKFLLANGSKSPRTDGLTYGQLAGKHNTPPVACGGVYIDTKFMINKRLDSAISAS